MSGVQQITIGDDEAEQRLDRWFRRRWPHVSQGKIERMCRKGEIRVDGGRVRAAARVSAGQVVRIPPLLGRPENVPQVVSQQTDKARLSAARDLVLFRDDHLLVLNKPPGLAVQGGSGQTHHLGQLLGALRFEKTHDPRLVHRLDRDTSGLLVLARTGAAATALGHLFRSRRVEKTYVAVVAGKPEPSAGVISYGLVKLGGPGTERMEWVHPDAVDATPGARRAETHYRVIEQAGGRIAAVALKPVTGRTHQLRAHMAALGNPIAGDGKYGGRSQTNDGDGWGAGLGENLSRELHLHALNLRFSHPVSQSECRFYAPLPKHMQQTWRLMNWDPADLDVGLFNDL